MSLLSNAVPAPMLRLFNRLTAGRNTRAIMMVTLAWALQFSCGVLTSVMVARYLGPSDFGTLNYVLALMGFGGTLAGFGVANVVTRELFQATRPVGTVLGTAVMLRVITGSLAICGMLTYLHFFEGNATAARLLVVAVGMLLIDGSLIFDCELQAQRAFGASSRAKATLAFTSLLLRGSLVLAAAGLVNFVAVQYVELLLSITVFGWAARQYLAGLRAGWDGALAAKYLRQGLPIMLAGFATAIYLRIDQVMIAKMLGSAELGKYSAGVKLVEVASFFPGILAYVLYPSILEAQKISAEKAEGEAIKLYRVMYVAALLFSLTMTVIGDWLTHLMFGAAYDGAGAVLKVYVWSSVFVFLTIASQAQLLSQEKTTHVVAVRTAVGAAANIGLNLLLIPRMGVLGAAWATVISYGIAVFFFYDRKYSWPPVRSMLRALTLRL